MKKLEGQDIAILAVGNMVNTALNVASKVLKQNIIKILQ